MGQKIVLLLTKYERDLVAHYGYPFEEIANQLERWADTAEPKIIEADQFWMEQLLGDLSRSINQQEIPDRQTELAVHSIAERIEAAIRM